MLDICSITCISLNAIAKWPHAVYISINTEDNCGKVFKDQVTKSPNYWAQVFSFITCKSSANQHWSSPLMINRTWRQTFYMSTSCSPPESNWNVSRNALFARVCDVAWCGTMLAPRPHLVSPDVAHYGDWSLWSWTPGAHRCSCVILHLQHMTATIAAIKKWKPRQVSSTSLLCANPADA